MGKGYNEVMEHIEVTPEMRQRILEHINQADLTKNVSGNIVRFPHIKRLAALAACLAVVLVGALTLPSLFHEPDDSNVLVAGNGIVQVSSVEELAERVGFDVTELDGLPFQADEAIYTAYRQALAEITYSGEGQTAVYRKGTGSEDVSGDYKTYENETEIFTGNTAVTLKGNSGSYTLAVWTDGKYAYSIAFSHGMDENSWNTFLTDKRGAG